MTRSTYIEPAAGATPVVLSYGLGWDSTAILVRWLEDPSSRDFDLSDLTVITAMTGDEFQSMGRLVSDYVLPLMRKHGVRYIQVARGGASTKDGVTVLDDSRSPDTLYLDGVYKLSDELLAAATVPQFGGARLCSQKQKGVPLDFVIDHLVGNREFRHVMGFNADETKRVQKDRSYSAHAGNEANSNRHSEYPLVEWGWGRAKLETYLRKIFGVEWEKSCCTFCPFAGSCRSEKLDALTLRYEDEPEAAVLALTIERRSLAFNVRQTLFAGLSLRDALVKHSPTLVELADEDWDSSESWSLYSVRRSFRGKGQAYRSLNTVDSGSKDAMLALLADEGEVEHTAGSYRVFVKRKSLNSFPTNEAMFVVAPSGVADKEGGKFLTYWVRTGQVETARDAGLEEPSARRRSKKYVSNWLKAKKNATFTKGECLKEAGPHGVFTAEAGATFDRAKAAGFLMKQGRRLRVDWRELRRLLKEQRLSKAA